MRDTLIRIFRPIVSNYVYTVRRGPGKGLKRRGGFEFVPERLVALGEEDRFLMGLDLKGKTVFDIGGFQGRLTIFFARAVGSSGKVITFEPNPRNCNMIQENVRLNGFTNVEVRQIGVGSSPGHLHLRFDDKDTGRSSFRDDYFDRRSLKANHDILIQVDSIDRLVSSGLSKPDFCKIDVEEFEFEVLLGMRETIQGHRPQLHIEMHGRIDNVERVLNLLFEYGYSVRHVELGVAIDSSEIRRVTGGNHIFCQ